MKTALTDEAEAALTQLARAWGWDRLSTDDLRTLMAAAFHYYVLRLRQSRAAPLTPRKARTMTERKAGHSRLVYNKTTRTIDTVRTEALPIPEIEKQVLAAYDASDRHIPDSDLDDEQPIALLVRTTLGEIRRMRRHHAMIARGSELAAEEERARIAYEDSL